MSEEPVKFVPPLTSGFFLKVRNQHGIVQRAIDLASLLGFGNTREVPIEQLLVSLPEETHFTVKWGANSGAFLFLPLGIGNPEGRIRMLRHLADKNLVWIVGCWQYTHPETSLEELPGMTCGEDPDADEARAVIARQE